MTEATASKIGSEKLKINADNIKSVLVKNTKIISRLKAFKAKTIFKAKEAKKISTGLLCKIYYPCTRIRP